MSTNFPFLYRSEKINNHPLFSNPLNDKNKSLILRIVYLVALIFLHIITLGILLLSYQIYKKCIHCASLSKKSSVSVSIPSKIATLPEMPSEAELDSMENLVADYVNKVAPQESYRFNPEGSVNPRFKFSYPQEILSYFKENNPEIFRKTDKKNKPEAIRNTYLLQQIAYLSEKYYLIDIRGDGQCFFRSIGLSWLFSLLHDLETNPAAIQQWIEFIASQQAFFNNSKENAIITQQMTAFLRTLQLNPSPENLLSLLLQPQNEKNLTAYFHKLCNFLAHQSRELSPEFLVPLITNNTSVFQTTLEMIQKQPQLSSMLLVTPKTNSFTEQISSVITCPITSSNNIINRTAIPFLSALFDFLDVTESDGQANALINEFIQTHPDLYAIWQNFIQKPHIQPLQTTLQMLLFLNTYNVSRLLCLLPEQRQAFTNFSNNIASSISDVQNLVNEEFIKKLNISALTLSSAYQTTNFNLNIRNLLFELFKDVSSIQCSQESLDTLQEAHDTICQGIVISKQNTIAILNIIENNPELKEAFKNFLSHPLTEQIKETGKKKSLNIKLLLLFMNNYPSLITSIISPEERQRLGLEQAFLHYQLALNSFNWSSKTKALTSVKQELINHSLVLSENLSFHEILNGMLQNFPSCSLYPDIKILFETFLYRIPADTRTREVLNILKTCVPEQWELFKERIKKTFPKINENSSIFLFLSQYRNLQESFDSASHQICHAFYEEFFSAWQENLKQISFKDCAETFEKYIEFRNNSRQRLLRHILNNDTLKESIVLNLNRIAKDHLPRLSSIYLSITSSEEAQAETEHVEALRPLLPFGLCQFFGNRDTFSTEDSIRQAMATNGFLQDFPETSNIALLRFSNHYAALIKKPAELH